MKPTTHIREAFNGGHQVGFSIGCQTFFLQERESEPEMTSLEHAKWLEKQLNHAFENLQIKRPSDKQLIETAILFNDGKLEPKILAAMVAMCEFVLDRLIENNDILKPSSKEQKYENP